jgi:hypothetical protein
MLQLSEATCSDDCPEPVVLLMLSLLAALLSVLGQWLVDVKAGTWTPVSCCSSTCSKSAVDRSQSSCRDAL